MPQAAGSQHSLMDTAVGLLAAMFILPEVYGYESD